MSGGYFNYEQKYINEIALAIDDLLVNNHSNEDTYSPEIIEQFKVGLSSLKVASIYAQRIDWLVSGDDGEQSFLGRLKDDLNEL